MFGKKFYACTRMSKRINEVISDIDYEMRCLRREGLLTEETERGMHEVMARLEDYYWQLKNPTALSTK